MRKEYNIKKLKLKRRGVLPQLEDEEKKSGKVRITIALDKEIIDYFKNQAKHAGSLPYQTQINQTLREIIHECYTYCHAEADIIKADLLNDTQFIKKIADKIKKKCARK